MLEWQRGIALMSRLAANDPFVLSDVEGRAQSAAFAARTSTSLSVNRVFGASRA